MWLIVSTWALWWHLRVPPALISVKCFWASTLRSCSLHLWVGVYFLQLLFFKVRQKFKDSGCILEKRESNSFPFRQERVAEVSHTVFQVWLWKAWGNWWTHQICSHPHLGFQKRLCSDSAQMSTTLLKKLPSALCHHWGVHHCFFIFQIFLCLRTTFTLSSWHISLVVSWADANAFLL